LKINLINPENLQIHFNLGIVSQFFTFAG